MTAQKIALAIQAATLAPSLACLATGDTEAGIMFLVLSTWFWGFAIGWWFKSEGWGE